MGGKALLFQLPSDRHLKYLFYLDNWSTSPLWRWRRSAAFGSGPCYWGQGRGWPRSVFHKHPVQVHPQAGHLGELPLCPSVTCGSGHHVCVAWFVNGEMGFELGACDTLLWKIGDDPETARETVPLSLYLKRQLASSAHHELLACPTCQCLRITARDRPHHPPTAAGTTCLWSPWESGPVWLPPKFCRNCVSQPLGPPGRSLNFLVKRPTKSSQGFRSLCYPLLYQAHFTLDWISPLYAGIQPCAQEYHQGHKY